MSHPASILLSDDAVCTVVNTCFHVVQQVQCKGDLLQRNGKNTMHEIIQIVYSRLPEIECEKKQDQKTSESDDEDLDADNDVDSGYGVRCAVDIFHFLCSLLNVVEIFETEGMSSQRTDEDVQVFGLVLINTALELSGDVIAKRPKLLRMIQDDLFHHLIHYGTRSSPLVLSMICSTVLNIYHFLRSSVRLQLEAFFTYVLLKIVAQGSSVQLQEVALEGVINFCMQPAFLFEAYLNYDCSFLCGNLFEEIGRLLCKHAFPVDNPLTSIQVQAFEGLMLLIHAIADNVDKAGSVGLCGPYEVDVSVYTPFWEESPKGDKDTDGWVESLRVKKNQKKKILIAGSHFNLDDKKGLEYLKLSNLIPDSPEEKAFAYFFRFTPGLDKTMIGDYLGDPDEFHIHVLKEFTQTFDFTGMLLDSALRTYLETFRLPGESQKIQRILEPFSEHFFEQQSLDLFESKDVVYILCYSLIMLNTDQHNPQVKKKMTEDEFIRNNREINGGKDLPREYLSELFQSIANNAITIFFQAGVPAEMNPNRWIELMNRSKAMEPFVTHEFNHKLARDMFANIAGPSVAVISAVFEHAEEHDILNECIEGLISVARIAQFGLEDILDELIASFCKFTTLLNPYASPEETLYIFANDLKPRMATLAIFTVANKFGGSIRDAWRNIVDCLLKLKRLKLLPQSVVDPDALLADEPSDSTPRSARAGLQNGTGFGSKSQKASTIGRFSHFLAMENGEDSLVLGGSEFEQNLKVIQQCKIGSIFSNSAFLPEDALLNLGRSLIFAAAGKGQKFSTAVEEEETVGFCWDLIVVLGFVNFDRYMTIWPAYHEYMISVAQFPMFSPVPFAEKAIIVLLKLCLKILSSYQSENNLEELIFKSINLMWKYDMEILETCSDAIMQTVCKILNDYPANVQTQLGWKSLFHLLSVTGRRPDSYDQGVETIINLLHNCTHVSRTNYAYCIDCAFAFVALKNSPVDKNVKILDLMANSVKVLVKCYRSFSDPGTTMSNASSSSTEENTMRSGNFTMNLFVKLGEALRKTSLARREEVRNHAVSSLKKSFIFANELDLTPANCISSFAIVIFTMVDDLRLIAENPGFRSFWLGVLRRMDTLMKADLGEHGPSKMEEVVPELLKKIIAAMKENDILVPARCSLVVHDIIER